MFKMPGESSTCKAPYSMAKKEGNSPNPGETLLGYLKQPPPSSHGSSQVDMADIMAHSSHSLLHGNPERDTSPTPLPLPANSINLLVDVLHLQEEMNDAMVHLLSARAAMYMCCQWVISETEVSHCQNKIDTSEAIREIKAWYTAMIGDAKAIYRTAMRKAEALHLASTSKVEVTQATSIRKAEATNVAWASKLQWQHQEAMWNLEEEALKEEKCTHQSFLWACGAALQSCPNNALAKLMYPFPSVNGKSIPPRPIMATSPLTTRLRNPITSPCHPTVMVPSPRAKQCWSPEQEAEADHPGEPTPQRQGEEIPLERHLGDSHCEAFCKDSELVQQIRQTYFRTHALTFHKEDTYELMEVFKELAEMASLLGTEVYPFNDQWVGRKELHSAYHVVRGPLRTSTFSEQLHPLNNPG